MSSRRILSNGPYDEEEAVENEEDDCDGSSGSVSLNISGHSSPQSQANVPTQAEAGTVNRQPTNNWLDSSLIATNLEPLNVRSNNRQLNSTRPNSVLATAVQATTVSSPSAQDSAVHHPNAQSGSLPSILQHVEIPAVRSHLKLLVQETSLRDMNGVGSSVISHESFHVDQDGNDTSPCLSDSEIVEVTKAANKICSAAQPVYGSTALPTNADGADNMDTDMITLDCLRTSYMPDEIDLEYYLAPFVPVYTPAIGDINLFLNIPRPDGRKDMLGLQVLDEPAMKQSDPTILELSLRINNKEIGMKKTELWKSISWNARDIDNWIDSIEELHRLKQPPVVHYTRNMPSIDSLMQEWPRQFEDVLREVILATSWSPLFSCALFIGQVSLPTGDLNCNVTQFIDIVCGLCDIPVGKSRIQSLHLFFTLFTEFKNSQHFGAKNTNCAGDRTNILCLDQLAQPPPKPMTGPPELSGMGPAPKTPALVKLRACSPRLDLGDLLND